MEVHHHPQLHHEKKPWKEYVLEGFMIFLAVFMGFIAENIREAYTEHQREREYIHAIVEDIKSDTLQSNKVLVSLNKTKIGIDTLLTVLASEEVITNSRNAYRLWLRNLGFADFVHNDGTLQQLKNNGGLRMIRNQAVVDSIMKYDQIVRVFYEQATLMDNALADQVMFGRMFDFITIRRNGKDMAAVPLPEESKKILNQAYANRKIWNYGLMSLIYRLRDVNVQGKRVISFIKKQYDLE